MWWTRSSKCWGRAASGGRFLKFFPPFTSVQNYFYAGRDTGVLDRMLNALRSLARGLAGRSEEPTAAAIDSQSVKTTESGGPSGYDAGKKVKDRKRYITVDMEGTPISVAIHRASVQDQDGALDVILAMLENAPEVTKTVGGRRIYGAETGGRAGGARSGGILEIV